MTQNEKLAEKLIMEPGYGTPSPEMRVVIMELVSSNPVQALMRDLKGSGQSAESIFFAGFLLGLKFNENKEKP